MNFDTAKEAQRLMTRMDGLQEEIFQLQEIINHLAKREPDLNLFIMLDVQYRIEMDDERRLKFLRLFENLIHTDEAEIADIKEQIKKLQ